MQWPEKLKLHGGEHPGTSLVSVPLDGSNFLTWSRSIKLALKAKQKLGFVDGTYPKPEENKVEMEQWERVDCMKVSWLLNSITKDIAEAFLYTSSAQDLWEQLEARFGESNEPMLYDIQKKITQGDMTISTYFTKMKKLWDELAYLDPLPKCSCGATKALADKNTSSQLIQFLMGLEESYDSTRSQILLMEPLPTIGKAYSMLLRVEKQRMIHIGATQDGAMNVKSFNPKKPVNGDFRQKNRGQPDRRAQYCEYCKRNGHTKDSCFKLKGYPDWYKELLEQTKIGKGAADRTYFTKDSSQKSLHDMGPEFSNIIKMEVRKAVQE
ncbi:UNVERIFIED_CONTAM: hypothetical protein Sindi_0660000 [Sesamum indicum]